jgi:hypothetical protein
MLQINFLFFTPMCRSILYFLIFFKLFLCYSPEACAAILWKTAKAAPKVYTVF